MANDEAAEARGSVVDRTRMLTQSSLQSNSMLSSSFNDPRMGGLGMDSLTQGSYSAGYDGGADHSMMQASMAEMSLHGSTSSHHPSQHTHPNERSLYMDRMHSEGSIIPAHKDSPTAKSVKSLKGKSPTHVPFAAAASADRSSHNNSQYSKTPRSNSVSRVPSIANGLDEVTLDTHRTEDNSGRPGTQANFTEDLSLLVSRPFALPFESKNCLVQVYTSKTYDENVYLKVVTSGISPQVLCERPLQIDKAYEVVNAAGNSNNLIHGSGNEDLGTLSTLLINMFQEADDDNSGKLLLPFYYRV
jgi:hypothetical protein